MARRKAARKVQPTAVKSIDVFAETLSALPFADRERFDAQLARAGLRLASRRDSDAFWLDVAPYWFWVKATRLAS